MNWRSQIASAPVGGARTPYIFPGNLRLALNAFKEVLGGFNGDSLVAEFYVIESKNQDETKGVNPAESLCSMAGSLTGNKGQRTIRDFKAMLAGVCGIGSNDPRAMAEINENVVNAAIQGVLRGHVVDCYAYLRNSKTDPTKFFTNMIWSPVLGPDGLPMKHQLGGGSAPAQKAPSVPPPAVVVPPAPPPVAAPPALTQAWPPAGWTQHPHSPGHWYRGQTVLVRSDLERLQAEGKA